MFYTYGKRSANMVNVFVILGRFIFIFSLVFYILGRFNKTIVPLAFVGYEMIITNSYPTRAHGIIANYFELYKYGKCALAYKDVFILIRFSLFFYILVAFSIKQLLHSRLQNM